LLFWVSFTFHGIGVWMGARHAGSCVRIHTWEQGIVWGGNRRGEEKGIIRVDETVVQL
jgi:hypothetical protein